MRARILAVLALLGCPLAAIGQSSAPPVVEERSGAAERPFEPVTAAQAASGRTAAADGELKLVVALFRHGVRAPLSDLNGEEKHSKDRWPTLADWRVMGADCDKGNGWGYLTIQGQKVAQGLGSYYGKYYKQGTWSSGFKVYVWADAENQRTRETAKALAQGFNDADIPPSDVTVASLQACTVDLLFHPFKAGCGTPDSSDLKRMTSYINRNWSLWRERYGVRFNQFYSVLGCGSDTGCWFTTPDYASPWLVGEQRSSPVKWAGRFSYASTASEAFLLEYANNMNPVGWGRVDTPALRTMPFLHEFFFDETERRRYLAQIQGSNLIKEISDVVNRKATGKESGCPHAPPESQFVGLVGHDTNLAHVGALLGLRWEFNDQQLPDDTKGLPENDALPAGALVFELRQRHGGWFVSIEYVTQSLLQMRNGPKTDAFRLAVRSPDCVRSPALCEMSLDMFNKRVNHALGKDNRFLSRCDGITQSCSQVAHPASKR